MKRALSLASIFFGLSLVVRAQAPPPPPDPPTLVTMFLGLSSDQAAQFQQLLRDLQATAQALQQQVRMRQQRLDEMAGASAPDTPAMGRLVLEIRALNRQMAQALQSFHDGFVALLQPEQRQKLQADEQQVMAQLDKVLSAEREIKRMQIGLMVRIKNKLTAEQQAKLRQLR